MDNKKIVIIGVGATGAVLAAALHKNVPDIVLLDPMPGLGDKILKNGISVSGALSYPSVKVKYFHEKISDLKRYDPDIIFISTRTFILNRILDELKDICRPGVKIISTQNGLGTEDLIADKFGKDSAFRMSLNFGVISKGKGYIETTFFNRPNHLGALSQNNRQVGKDLAALFTDGSLHTEYVDDIKLFVWKKMIMKCTTSSLCALTDRTLKSLLDFPPTREIIEDCFKEVLAVAKAMGYDLGEDYQKQAIAYLEKVGEHKDSMCQDVINKRPTEIDFLGGRVIEYARIKGIDVPYYITITNLIKTMEDSYLKKT